MCPDCEEEDGCVCQQTFSDYEVKDVIGEREFHGRHQFLVRCIGHDNKLLPAVYLDDAQLDCPRLIKEYEELRDNRMTAEREFSGIANGDLFGKKRARVSKIPVRFDPTPVPCKKIPQRPKRVVQVGPPPPPPGPPPESGHERIFPGDEHTYPVSIKRVGVYWDAKVLRPNSNFSVRTLGRDSAHVCFNSIVLDRRGMQTLIYVLRKVLEQ